jgi:predicted lipoprotein with Yx(FWY)xxD motif
MTDSAQRKTAGPQRKRILQASLAAAVIALGAFFAAMAFASSSAVTIDSASNAKLDQQVLVNTQGRTLYALTPETAKHLLCKTSECLELWPPLTVASRSTKLKLAAGVHGRLGILRRSNGMLQVTINGLPLYRFAEDRASGEVNGQNFKSFGGTWHVLSDAGAPSSKEPAASAPAPTSTTPTTSTPTTTTPASSSPGW